MTKDLVTLWDFIGGTVCKLQLKHREAFNVTRIHVAPLEDPLSSEFPPFLNLIHPSADNRMDAATKSRTSEDILRSSRLSTYSPEPCSQSESDFCPYTSSPRGTNRSSSTVSHHSELRCCRSVERRTAPVPSFPLALPRSRLPVFVPRRRFHLFSLSQPIGCRGDATRREETKRVGATAFKG